MRPRLGFRAPSITCRALLALALTVPTWPAQEVVLRASRLDDLWAGSDGRIRAQTGGRVVRLESGGAAVRVVDSFGVPTGFVVFDEDDGQVTGLGAFGRRTVALQDLDQGESAAPPGAETRAADGSDGELFGGLPASDHPVHVRLSAGGTGLDWGIDGALLRFGPAAAPWDLRPFCTRTVTRRGFGLTAVVTEELRVPWFFPVATRRGPAALAETRSGFERITRSGRVALEPVPLDERGGIEGFDWTVAPIVLDLDGDGDDDLVRVDAGRGVIAIQGGLGLDILPSPQVLVIGSPVVAAGIRELTGDGRLDLFLVRLPALNILQQISILTERKIAATVMVYEMDGSALRTSPTKTRVVSLNLEVSVVDDERRGHFRTLIAPTAAGIVLSTPGEAARLVPWGGGPAVNRGLVEAGEWAEALAPLVVGGAIFASLRGARDGALICFRP